MFVGVVGQEPVLFSGTIRENITLGLEDVSEEEVVAATETAHAHQFITKLPQVSVPPPRSARPRARAGSPTDRAYSSLCRGTRRWWAKAARRCPAGRSSAWR